MNYFNRKIIVIVMLLICVTFIIACGNKNERKKENMLSQEEKGEDDRIISDEELGTWHNISDNGAVMYAFDSIPSQVIEAAKKFIVESGCDGNNIVFDFKNSPYTHPSIKEINEVLEVFDDVYSPKQYLDEKIYYVVEGYKYRKDKFSIIVGYFIINESGDIIQCQNMKTREELEGLKPKISTDEAYDIAKGQSDSHYSNMKLYCYKDNKDVLCYKVMFDNGTNIYVNAITGEIIE